MAVPALPDLTDVLIPYKTAGVTKYNLRLWIYRPLASILLCTLPLSARLNPRLT